MDLMDEVLEILNDLNPDVDYEICDSLVEDEILTSFELVMLVTRIGEEFGVTVPSEEITPENFNSAESICDLIRRLQEDD